MSFQDQLEKFIKEQRQEQEKDNLKKENLTIEISNCQCEGDCQPTKKISIKEGSYIHLEHNNLVAEEFTLQLV